MGLVAVGVVVTSGLGSGEGLGSGDGSGVGSGSGVGAGGFLRLRAPVSSKAYALAKSSKSSKVSGYARLNG